MDSANKMTAHQKILALVPTLQSITLASKNYQLVKKKKKKAKDFLYQGVENIVGTSLIKETAQFLED